MVMEQISLRIANNFLYFMYSVESAYAEFARTRPPGIYEEYIVAGLRAHYALDAHTSSVVRPPTPDWLKPFEHRRQRQRDHWNNWRAHESGTSSSGSSQSSSASHSPNEQKVTHTHNDTANQSSLVKAQSRHRHRHKSKQGKAESQTVGKAPEANAT